MDRRGRMRRLTEEHGQFVAQEPNALFDQWNLGPDAFHQLALLENIQRRYQ